MALNFHAVPVTRARTEPRALLRARAAIVLRPMSFSTQVFWRRVNSALTFLFSFHPLEIGMKTGLFLRLFLQLRLFQASDPSKVRFVLGGLKTKKPFY